MAVIKSLGYNVVTGTASLKQLGLFVSRANYSSVFILCDENTLQHCLPLLILHCPVLAHASVIEIESGEDSKSLEICAQIWRTLAENKAGRDTLLVNLGGGVVSDLGGFCASVYKRGIDFIHVPTSLLAMADASIGGKTAIDFASVKNLIGSFAQPKAVFIYPPFLQTLPPRHVNNGMAEVYKMAIVADKKFWQLLTKNKNRPSANVLLSQSLLLKNAIVLRDPFDTSLRKILNFGHTVGHALEMQAAEAGLNLLHGEAVYIGMIIESHIAWQKKLVSKNELDEITTALKGCCVQKEVSYDAIAGLMQNDKKNRAGRFLFSLPRQIGKCVYDVPVTPGQVKKAILYYNKLA